MRTPSSHAIRDALQGFDAMNAVITCGAAEDVYIMLDSCGSLTVTDAGATYVRLQREEVSAPDAGIAEALCAEHGCRWVLDPEGAWILRHLGIHESPMIAVERVVAARASVLDTAESCNSNLGACNG